jgi:hypothetical protein
MCLVEMQLSAVKHDCVMIIPLSHLHYYRWAIPRQRRLKIFLGISDCSVKSHIITSVFEKIMTKVTIFVPLLDLYMHPELYMIETTY